MGDTRPAAPDVCLYRLLDACDATQIKQVADTGHIRCEIPLLEYLSREVFDYEGQPFSTAILADAFRGQPVKQVWATCRSYLKKPDPVERGMAIRKRARRRTEESRVA